jgi:hypothetical protein
MKDGQSEGRGRKALGDPQLTAFTLVASTVFQTLLLRNAQPPLPFLASWYLLKEKQGGGLERLVT